MNENTPHQGPAGHSTDPTTRYYSEQFEPQQQTYPGFTEQMRPRPDHGEKDYRGSQQLQGKKALITGADSGIGRAVALAFAREGADVAITHLPEEEQEAAETVRLIEEAGRKGVFIGGDLQEESFCQQVVEQSVAALGGLDILVNNAGYQMTTSGTLEDLSTEQLVRTYTTNIFALIWVTKAALKHLRPGASIINTTSIQGYHPSPSLIDYAGTKAAINSMTFSLAQSLGPRGIRVNAVAPGPIWTPLQPATQPVQKVEMFGQDTPLGRAGQPAELASTYVFLAADSASYVSGEIVGVTGGRYLA